jgi:two-component system NtrC family sensor kinase
MEEKKRNELNAQLVLSDKLAALGKMAAGIGHEINNPLAVIYQITGWMRDLLIEEEDQESKNREEYLTCLTKIDENVRRVREVVHNMLAYAGKLDISSDEIDVNSTINRAVSLLNNFARIHNINISTDLSLKLPVIKGNRADLEQVFFNFISNAVDAIGKDGSIQVKSKRIDSHIAVSIADDGPGIPADQQSKIFDPFFTTKVTGKGTGLGLWVNYSFIEKMGGSISVKSEAGVGTTFIVHIPVAGPRDK